MAVFKEKRKHQRSPVPLHVEVRLESGVLVEGCAINISLNGILFETERSLPVGCRVRVHLTHESIAPQHVVCQGEVCRQDDWGVAISLEQMQPEHVDVLYRCMEHMTSNDPLVRS